MSLAERSPVYSKARNFFAVLPQSIWESLKSMLNYGKSLQNWSAENLYFEKPKRCPSRQRDPSLFGYLLSILLWNCQTCLHLNNVTARKKTSDEHRIQLLKVQQRKPKKFFFPKEFIIINSHELLHMWSPTERNYFIAVSLQKETVKTHLNIKDTWDFHLKEKNKALRLL